jgi:hypothetical protein
VNFLGLAAPEWFFSSQSFHIVINILSYSSKIFCCTQTHTFGLIRSQYLFSIILCGVFLNDSVFHYVIGDSWLTVPTVCDCGINHNYIRVFTGWKEGYNY